MAKEKGDLLRCLDLLAHHVAPHKTTLLFGAGLSIKDLGPRFAAIREEAEIASRQVERMKRVAEEKGYQDILDIINEVVEYGIR